uniref:Aminopeptidase n=1 Tax=Sitophilus oryzae TaxID=7048 RepID=D9J2F8_SITOR|nr:aminopeptidase N [Sitophilus oryzae]
MPTFIWILPILLSLTIAQEYRLPTNINPTSYKINLVFASDIFTTANASAYNGTTEITFVPTQNTSSVVLHASAEYLNVTTVTLSDSISVSNYSVDSVTDIFTVEVNETLIESQTYTITIGFDGKISTTDTYGIYKSSYTDSSNTTYYFIITQFQATYARRAFPCLDETGYKATFDITLSYPVGLNVLSNAEISNSTNITDTEVTTTFNTTPKISTYLIAFIVSEFTCSQGDLIEGSLVNQVCSRNETADTRSWALELAPLVIDSINSYTGINYSRSMNKLDQIAVTDLSFSGMENWGIVTYREKALLYDEEETSNSYKEYIANLVAHELAHQWFGNLVTCKWWSEIFLNEGMATLLEYFIAHEILPGYDMDKQFVIQTVHSIFEEDASTTESLRANASSPAQISSKFGSITYNKGGSVLRMVEKILGTETWKSGLNTYLNQFAYGSVEPEDLWDTLALNSTINAAPANLTTLLHNWVYYPGYPVLDVSLNGTEITITQKRFVYDSNVTSEVTWYVPITYTTSADTSTFTDTTPALWLPPNSVLSFQISSNDSWIVINNLQTGYYRVNYDSTLWSRLAVALQASNFSDIPEINRAQIINDGFSLARAGSLSYNQLFNVTQFLANETTYAVWYPSFNGFDYLLKRVGRNSTLGSSILNHLSTLYASLIASVPLSVVNASNHVYTMSQVQAQTWACSLGNSDCVNTAVELFKNYTETSIRPNKNLRSIAYCYGLKYSADINSDWNFLWNAYLNTSLSTEQATVLAALGCTSNETILNGYLNKTLNDNSGVRSQDYASVFSAVYQKSDIGVDFTLDFYINNFNLILQRYTSVNAAGNILKKIAELITTESQFKKLENFIATDAVNSTIREAAAVAKSSAENNLAWVNTYRQYLLDYYGITETDSTSSTSSTASTTTSTSTTTTSTTETPSTTPSTATFGYVPVTVLIVLSIIFPVMV